jgi:hypothetical protein
MNAIDESLIAAISASDGVTPPKPKRYGCSLVAVAYGDNDGVQAAVDTRPRVLFVDRISTVAETV